MVRTGWTYGLVLALAGALVLYGPGLHAQEAVPRAPDSLYQALAKPQAATSRYEAMHELGEWYRRERVPDSFVVYNNKLLAQEALIPPAQLGQVYRSRGIYFYHKSWLDSAQHYMLRAMGAFEEAADSIMIARTHTALGAVFAEIGLTDQALKHYQAALELLEAIGESGYGMTLVKNNIANALNDAGKIREGMDILFEILVQTHTDSSFTAWQRDENYGYIYFNLGNYYGDLHMEDSCRYYYALAVPYFEKIEDDYQAANLIKNLGQSYADEGQLAMSDSCYWEALRRFEALGSLRMLAQCYSELSDNAYDRGDVALEQEYIEKAYKLAEESGSLETLQHVLAEISHLYNRLGRYAEAYDLQERYINISDSLVNNERREEIDRIHRQLDARAYTAQIAQLESEASLREAAASALRQRQWALSLGVVLLLALSGLVYWAYQQKKADNKALTESREKLAQQHRQILQQQNELKERNASLFEAMQELQSTQEQLLVTEKLAAMGRLVSNVAHEINTPIAAIKATASASAEQMHVLLESWEAFSRGLSDADRQAFGHILRGVDEAPLQMSTRAYRTTRRGLEAELKAAGYPGYEELAELMLRAGLSETKQLPQGFSTSRLIPLLEMASRVNHLRQAFWTIGQSTERTSKIVYALKSLSGLAQVGGSQVDVYNSMQMALEPYSHYFEKGVHLQQHWSVKPKLLAVADHLRQLWGHLVLNAIQAMEADGQLSIRAQQVDEGLLVQIRDTGPGISPAEQLRVFEPFYSTRNSGEGAGLGLYLCKQVVEKYEGRISLQSQPGETVFSVWLPLARQAVTA